MSGITVYAHIRKDMDVAVELRDGDRGRYAVIETGSIDIFINSREKALEIASLLEKSAQQWEDES